MSSYENMSEDQKEELKNAIRHHTIESANVFHWSGSKDDPPDHVEEVRENAE